MAGLGAGGGGGAWACLQPRVAASLAEPHIDELPRKATRVHNGFYEAGGAGPQNLVGTQAAVRTELPFGLPRAAQHMIAGAWQRSAGVAAAVEKHASGGGWWYWVYRPDTAGTLCRRCCRD